MAELLKRAVSPKKNLVFTSAGNKSALALWVNGQRDFDLFCVYYASGKEEELSALSDYFACHKGAKFPNLLWVYQNWPELIEQYERVLVLDDDLLLTADNINRHFSLHTEEKLWLSQLAFHHRGKVNHYINLARPFSYLRYTNFVEVNSPLFNIDMLLKFLQVYDAEVAGIGVDYWYSDLISRLDQSQEKIAIFDIIPCCNPRDQIAKGGVREIDTAISFQDRMKSWDVKAAKLGIERNYKKIEYRSKKPPSIFATIMPSIKILFFSALYHAVILAKFSKPYPTKDS